jgi:hypothetical protein
LALGVTACSNGGSSASSAKPTTSTPTSPPTTTATTLDAKAAAEAAVLRDYRAFWDAYSQATGVTGLPVNPDDPVLSAHATGKELIQVRSYAGGLRGKGYRGRADGLDEFRPRVVSIVGTTAIVDDCVTDNTHVVDAKTGELHDAPGPAKLGWEADMVLEGGTWKASEMNARNDLCAG